MILIINYYFLFVFFCLYFTKVIGEVNHSPFTPHGLICSRTWPTCDHTAITNYFYSLSHQPSLIPRQDPPALVYYYTL